MTCAALSTNNRVFLRTSWDLCNKEDHHSLSVQLSTPSDYVSCPFPTLVCIIGRHHSMLKFMCYFMCHDLSIVIQFSANLMFTNSTHPCHASLLKSETLMTKHTVFLMHTWSNPVNINGKFSKHCSILLTYFLNPLINHWKQQRSLPPTFYSPNC